MFICKKYLLQYNGNKNKIFREERDNINYQEYFKILKEKGIKDRFLYFNFFGYIRNVN